MAEEKGFSIAEYNPFKDFGNNKAAIGGLVVGALIAGAATYLVMRQ